MRESIPSGAWKASMLQLRQKAPSSMHQLWMDGFGEMRKYGGDRATVLSRKVAS